MSKKQLLLNLLALSCLANGGINALEVPKAPPKDSVVSVTSKKGSAPAKVEGQSKSKDDFFHKYQSSIYSALGGLFTGAAAGGGFGYLLGGTKPKAQLAKANLDIQDLKNEINSLNSTIASKDSEIAKYKADDSIQKLEQQIATLTEQLNQEKEKVNQKDQKITELNTSVAQKENEINIQKNALNDANTKVEEANKKLSASGDQIKKDLADLNLKLNEKDQKILNLEKDINNLKTEKTNFENRKNKLNNDLARIEQENTKLRLDLDQTSKKLNKFGNLDPDSQDFINLKHNYDVVKSVLDLRKNKKAKVFGVDLQFAMYDWNKIKDLKFDSGTNQTNFIEHLADKVCDIKGKGMQKKDIGVKVFSDLILFSIALESKLQELKI